MSGPTPTQSAACPLFERLEWRLLLSADVGVIGTAEAALEMPYTQIGGLSEAGLTITLGADGEQGAMVLDVSGVQPGTVVLVFRDAMLIGQATAEPGATEVQVEFATPIAIGDLLTVEIYPPSPDGEAGSIGEPERVVQLDVSDTAIVWRSGDNACRTATDFNVAITCGETFDSDTLTIVPSSVPRSIGEGSDLFPSFTEAVRWSGGGDADDDAHVARRDSAAPGRFDAPLPSPRPGVSDASAAAGGGASSDEVSPLREPESGIFQLTLPAAPGGVTAVSAAAGDSRLAPINLLDRVRAFSMTPRTSAADGGPVDADPAHTSVWGGDGSISPDGPRAGGQRVDDRQAAKGDAPAPRTDARLRRAGPAASEDDDPIHVRDAVVLIVLLHGWRPRAGVPDLPTVS